MKTKLFALPLLLLILAAPSFSNDRAVDNVGIAGDRIVDNAGLLSDTERRALAALLDSVSLAHNFDIVIVSEKSIGQKTPEAFADDFFDNNGYGLGGGQDGSLFLQVTGSRDIHVSTAGRGIKTLRPAAREKLLSDAAKHLKKGETYTAYRAVVADWDKYLKLEAKGKSYNALDQSHIVLTLR